MEERRINSLLAELEDLTLLLYHYPDLQARNRACYMAIVTEMRMVLTAIRRWSEGKDSIAAVVTRSSAKVQEANKE